MTIIEQAAYLKGLAEGMNLDADKPETKLIMKLIETVSDMADLLDCHDREIDTHADYLDELDHDLGELEEEVYECLDELDDECDCGCDCDCDDD